MELFGYLTAEPFYAALGYHVENRRELAIGPGVQMVAVKMRKQLA